MTAQFHTSDSRSFDSYEAYREHLRAHPGVRGYGTCLPKGRKPASAPATVADTNPDLFKQLIAEVAELRAKVEQLEAQAHTHKRRTKS